MGAWKRSRRRAREVCWCASGLGRSCLDGVCRLMGIRGFVGGGGRGVNRLLGVLLCRVGTWLGVAVYAVGCGGSVG